MATVDSKAVWVMQGWLFYHASKFWQPTQIKALLNAVPNDKMMILDLFSEAHPAWQKTTAYYGKPWIWCMLHNFGGNTGMFGRLESIASKPAETRKDANSGNLVGIGLTPEAIEQNPVVYELMMENIWRENPIKLDEWLDAYIARRYGEKNNDASKAWEILKKTVYSETKDVRDVPESILTGRPTFEKAARWTRTPLHYKPQDLIPAWDYMTKAATKLSQSEGFRYDLIDVSRQVLVNYANVLQQKCAEAYIKNDIPNFKKNTTAFLELLTDTDEMLGTHQDFLLGKWLSAAKSWGTNPQETALYERNARNLITLWGDKDSGLHEYACKQWAGLIKDFYKKRWEIFFNSAIRSMEKQEKIDLKAFEESIKKWEWNWVNGKEIYPDKPIGDPIALSHKVYKKYIATIKSIYN